MKRIGFLLVAILAVALGLVVGALNSDTVKLDLLWLQLNWPLGLLVLTAFVSGVLLATVWSYFMVVLPLRIRLRTRQAPSKGTAAADAFTPDE